MGGRIIGDLAELEILMLGEFHSPQHSPANSPNRGSLLAPRKRIGCPLLPGILENFFRIRPWTATRRRRNVMLGVATSIKPAKMPVVFLNGRKSTLRSRR